MTNRLLVNSNGRHAVLDCGCRMAEGTATKRFSHIHCLSTSSSDSVLELFPCTGLYFPYRYEMSKLAISIAFVRHVQRCHRWTLALSSIPKKSSTGRTGRRRSVVDNYVPPGRPERIQQSAVGRRDGLVIWSLRRRQTDQPADRPAIGRWLSRSSLHRRRLTWNDRRRKSNGNITTVLHISLSSGRQWTASCAWRGLSACTGRPSSGAERPVSAYCRNLSLVHWLPKINRTHYVAALILSSARITIRHYRLNTRQCRWLRLADDEQTTGGCAASRSIYDHVYMVEYRSRIPS